MLIAPIDRILQTLVVHTIAEVVTSAQPLAIIVPRETVNFSHRLFPDVGGSKSCEKAKSVVGASRSTGATRLVG